MFSIVMLVIVCICGGAYTYYERRSEQKSFEEKNAEIDLEAIMKETAQDFINVKDIVGNYLYTEDDKVMSYIQIESLSIDLLSEKEKQVLQIALSQSLSKIHFKFYFLAMSRPVDVSRMINELKDMNEAEYKLINDSIDTAIEDLSEVSLRESKLKICELRELEIEEMYNMAMSGDVVERQFYIYVIEDYRKNCENHLRGKIDDIVQAFKEQSIVCNVLEQFEIVRLCNLINNPNYVQMEDTENFDRSIPIVKGV